MSGDVDSAINQLKVALTRPSTFRQAVSTLQFELGWLLLSRGDYIEASETFLKMVPLNSWSHSTYYALSAACLHQLDDRTPEQQESMREMYRKIPGGFNRKRFMGSPPSSEMYLDKRIKFYKAKTDRWIAAGKLPVDSEWFDSVRITVALELSLYGNQYAHYPQQSLSSLTTRLRRLIESNVEDLDTPEEIALCKLLLGACSMAASDLSTARQYFEEAVHNSKTFAEAYTFIFAMAKLYQATLECKEAEAETDKTEDVTFWQAKLAIAEHKLDELFAQTGYDMNGRIESRGTRLFFTYAISRASPYLRSIPLNRSNVES